MGLPRQGNLGMDERDKRDWVYGWEVEIFGKSRSFPLISVHLSRALGWVVGANGGGLGGFGGDIRGFGGPVRGFVGAEFGSSGFGCGHWDGSRGGGGTDLRRQSLW